MYVVATAGHVDHGKSTLVRALTGQEPDRWAEERRRGLTIDLGFAWTTLPDGAEVAFVDVPGHQRFIGNMLAGLGPAPAVMFVVAADEGWRAQSTEHLAAVDALGLRDGLLVVTRSDRTDPAPALAEALERLRASSLGAPEAVAVSGTTGAGLPQLSDALQRLVRRLPAPDTTAPVRLWIDRAFTIRGSGTVVTGTLGAGVLRIGDQVEVAGRPAVIRGLQSLDTPHDEVRAYARVAVNLRGLAAEDVARGDVLSPPGPWRTAHVDVRLTDPPTRLNPELVLHLGSAARPVHVRPLGADTARLTLPEPQPLRAGDRGILRDPGAQAVVTGIVVLDADPPVLGRRGAAAVRAKELEAATGTPDLVVEVARRGSVRRSHLAALGVPTSLDPAVRTVGDWVVAEATWQGWNAALPGVLRDFAATHPLEPGMPHDAVRRALGLPDPTLLAPLAVGQVDRDGRLYPPQTASTLGRAEDAIRTVETRLHDHAFAAPEKPELAALGLGRRELAAAQKAGRLLRLEDDVVLLPDGPVAALTRLADLPQPFTTSAARSALGTSRRVAIPLLEHLDALGWTRRNDANRREVVPDGG